MDSYILHMGGFDLCKAPSHAILNEFREGRITQIILTVLPFELDLVVLWNLYTKTAAHTLQYAAPALIDTFEFLEG